MCRKIRRFLFPLEIIVHTNPSQLSGKCQKNQFYILLSYTYIQNSVYHQRVGHPKKEFTERDE